jgi:hypothetical protein
MFILKTHYNTDHKEQFDPGLAYINSTEKLIAGVMKRKTFWLFPLILVFYRRKKVSNRSKYFTSHN